MLQDQFDKLPKISEHKSQSYESCCVFLAVDTLKMHLWCVESSPWQPEACRMSAQCWVSHRWPCFCDTERSDFSASPCHRWAESRYTWTHKMADMLNCSAPRNQRAVILNHHNAFCFILCGIQTCTCTDFHHINAPKEVDISSSLFLLEWWNMVTVWGPRQLYFS